MSNSTPSQPIIDTIKQTLFSSSKTFLEYVANKFEWEFLDYPVFMDIGCGSPEYFLGEYVIGRFPETVGVLSIDNCRSTIYNNNQREDPPDKRVIFRYGDIENFSTLSQWKGRIDKILSMNCFHMVRNQEEAFKNVFKLLKPGGEAGISFCLRSGYAAWHSQLEFYKWKPYLKSSGPNIPATQSFPPSHRYYEEILERIGFRIIYIRHEDIRLIFENDLHWKRQLLGKALKTFDIPNELFGDFQTDLYRVFALQNKKVNGLPCQHSDYLIVLLLKPMI